MNALSTERNDQPAQIILVVEDEPVIREFVCEILEAEGFKTEARDNADTALVYLEEHAADVCLLLTDIRMPGSMDGAQLTNLCGKTWPGIPVLVMSGHETPESSGVERPVTFIRKPWTIGQMVDGVASILVKDVGGSEPVFN